MNSRRTRTSMAPKPLPPDQVEMAKLYWDEFKYRHGHYWAMVFRFAFAVLFVLAVPFVHPEKISRFSRYTVLFPISGILLSVAAAWLLAAEYERIRAAYDRFSELRTEAYGPPQIARTGVRRILRAKIGTVITLLFLVGFLSLSAGALFVVVSEGTSPAVQARQPSPPPQGAPGGG